MSRLWLVPAAGLAVGAAALLIASSASAVTIDWTSVGNPGNACDTQPEGCFGSVAYSYRIGTYEVTNAQYAEFLNAVAATDTNALYATLMGDGFGGIARSGSPGSYTYNTIPGRENMPVNEVSLLDALRFANWLHNGQPTGTQTATTTEDGAYTFTGPATVGARNADATIFLTSENEWYKAAYYDALTASYFDYPAGSDAQTTCTAPAAAANTANCDSGSFNDDANDPDVDDLTTEGSFTGSASPYGTFDQGGNVSEWNEGALIRGGDFINGVRLVSASSRLLVGSQVGLDAPNLGFRVASIIPEPSTGLLGLAGWRRARA